MRICGDLLRVVGELPSTTPALIPLFARLNALLDKPGIRFPTARTLGGASVFEFLAQIQISHNLRCDLLYLICVKFLYCCLKFLPCHLYHPSCFCCPYYTIFHRSFIVLSPNFPTNTKIKDYRKDKDNKYQYQANVNTLIGSLRDKLADAVFSRKPAHRQKKLERIMTEIQKSVVPIRPDDGNTPQYANTRKTSHHLQQQT